MRTRSFSTDTFTAFFEGIFDGPIRLSIDPHKGIITTTRALVLASKTSSKTVSLTGPDWRYSTDEVTRLVKGQTQINDGDWKRFAIKVSSEDIRSLLIYALCENISFQANEVWPKDLEQQSTLTKLSDLFQSLVQMTGEESEIAKAFSGFQPT